MSADLRESAEPLHIHLNADAVAAPVHRAVRVVTELLNFCLNAVAEGDMTGPGALPPGASMGFQLFGALVPEERRTLYREWLILRGVQELARGVREMLEEAYLFVEIFHAPRAPMSVNAFQAQLDGVRKTGNRLNFPDLLAKVNARLDQALHFEREFLSLQRVRNCLEHRAGIVTDKDADAHGVLTLALPRFKIFTVIDGAEVEIAPGMTFAQAQTISLRRDIREYTYTIGDQLKFEHAQLHEAAFGCFLFGQDLTAKLPRTPS